MKKLMFALVAAGAAAVMAEEIASENIVGYTTKTIPATQYLMLAVQFDNTDGTAMNADEAFQLDKAPASWVDPEKDDECIAGWYTNAPCLKIPLGMVDQGYRDLYYTCNACYEESTDVWKGKQGWADMSGMLVEAPALLAGYGVWIKAANEPVTVTIAGGVKASSADTFSGGAGYNLLRLPYPVTINAGDSNIDWGLTSQAPASWVDPENDDECITGWYTNAPCLKIPLGTVNQGYRDLYYTSNACYEESTDVWKGKPGWADMSGMLVTDANIPEGQGFWLVLKAAATVTHTK